jgi:hypothetical protein
LVGGCLTSLVVETQRRRSDAGVTRPRSDVASYKGHRRRVLRFAMTSAWQLPGVTREHGVAGRHASCLVQCGSGRAFRTSPLGSAEASTGTVGARRAGR